jgi:hypothetical protein
MILFKLFTLIISLFLFACDVGQSGRALTLPLDTPPITEPLPPPSSGSDNHRMYVLSMYDFLDHMIHNLDRAASFSFSPDSSGALITTCNKKEGGRVSVGYQNQTLPNVEIDFETECDGWKVDKIALNLMVNQDGIFYTHLMQQTEISASSTHLQVGDQAVFNGCELTVWIDMLSSDFDPVIAANEIGLQKANIGGAGVIDCMDSRGRILECTWSPRLVTAQNIELGCTTF